MDDVASHDHSLDQIKRLVRFPSISYDHLPSLLEQASVLVMAYQANAATMASQPLKLKKYMASGNAVVARCIPATQDWADAIDLYESPAEFAASVRNRIESGVDPSQTEARKRLDDESWEAKARLFGATVTGRENVQVV